MNYNFTCWNTTIQILYLRLTPPLKSDKTHFYPQKVDLDIFFFLQGWIFVLIENDIDIDFASIWFVWFLTTQEALMQSSKYRDTGRDYYDVFGVCSYPRGILALGPYGGPDVHVIYVSRRVLGIGYGLFITLLKIITLWKRLGATAWRSSRDDNSQRTIKFGSGMSCINNKIK